MGTVGCHVRDPSLAIAGEDLIDRAARETPVLLRVRKRFERERPLPGLRVSACLHVTPETANLMITLKAGGAEVALCASNSVSTNDSVAAALATNGIRTYAIKDEDSELHRSHIATVLARRPHFTMDDGAELVSELHGGGRLVERVLGGTEATTAGARRVKALAAQGLLRYPVIAVEDAVGDLSLTRQALALEHLAGGARLGRGVHPLPVDIERELSRRPQVVGEGV